MDKNVDVCIVGGGSGGVAAAIAAGRCGLKTLLVEASDRLGGTSTRAGVSIWEMCCGGTGIPFDLYCGLKKIPKAVGFYRLNRHCCWPEDGFYPGGECLQDGSLTYRDSLCRNAQGALSFGRPGDKPLIRSRWHGMVFEPDAMARVMEKACRDAGEVEVRFNARMERADIHSGVVDRLIMADGSFIRASTYIDSTGDGVLCAACGCERHLGEDPCSRYGEQGAPEVPTNRVNGVTQVFRIGPKTSRCVDTPPIGIPAKCWWRDDYPVASCVQYPNGDFNINVLPTMEGREFLQLGYEPARTECLRRTYAFWRHWQERFPEWQDYRISWMAPELGVRESYRVVAEYMLTQHDLETGLPGQPHGDVIAINDHPMDLHGRHGGERGEVNAAYGIPFRCLVPKGLLNLLVASRAAGMSAIAASGCRTARAIMGMGQAAGTAAALAREQGCAVAQVDTDVLRRRLAAQFVQLANYLPEEIAQHCR